MRKHKAEKTTKIVRRLDVLKHVGNETLTKIANVIQEKVEFYDHCLASWDKPAEKFSPEEIDVGRKCCNAGLNIAGDIVNELRILFLEESQS